MIKRRIFMAGVFSTAFFNNVLASPMRNASTIINRMISDGAKIENVRVLNSRTDPNGLLGRPNQYTSKVIFNVVSTDSSNGEGTIEVFPTRAMAVARRNYVQRVTSSMPSFQQYITLNGSALLRVDFDVIPEEAEVIAAHFLKAVS